jgi:hypothetical protein
MQEIITQCKKFLPETYQECCDIDCRDCILNKFIDSGNWTTCKHREMLNTQ